MLQFLINLSLKPHARFHETLVSLSCLLIYRKPKIKNDGVEFDKSYHVTLPLTVEIVNDPGMIKPSGVIKTMKNALYSVQMSTPLLNDFLRKIGKTMAPGMDFTLFPLLLL